MNHSIILCRFTHCKGNFKNEFSDCLVSYLWISLVHCHKILILTLKNYVTLSAIFDFINPDPDHCFTTSKISEGIKYVAYILQPLKGICFLKKSNSLHFKICNFHTSIKSCEKYDFLSQHFSISPAIKKVGHFRLLLQIF